MKRYLILLCCCLPILGNGQIIETWAGGGTDPNDNIPANTAQIGGAPNTITIDKFGNYYLACITSHKIRKIDASGMITTVAGTGSGGYNGDGGSADTSKLKIPGCAAVDNDGNVYIADAENNRIRKIDIATGVISTVAGTGVQGYSGDGGLAVNATLYHPNFVFVAPTGNIFISDYNNSRIRKVDNNGIISTVVGNGIYGYDGDGGLATSAKISYTRSVIADAIGNLYVADWDYNNIRKVDVVTGIISTIAGTGFAGYQFNGDNIPAINANIKPSILAFDLENNLFISDAENDRVRKIDFSTGLMTTVAGDGTMAHGGDGGPATTAQLNRPSGITFDTCGNLYITQVNDNRIRKVTFNPNCTPTSITTSTSLTFTLSPNPATAHITITANTKLKQLHLTNAVGVTVLRAENESDKATIDISELPAGIYFLTVYDAQGNRRTEKIIKQ